MTPPGSTGGRAIPAGMPVSRVAASGVMFPAAQARKRCGRRPASKTTDLDSLPLALLLKESLHIAGLKFTGSLCDETHKWLEHPGDAMKSCVGHAT